MRLASLQRRKSRKASAWQALVPRCKSIDENRTIVLRHGMLHVMGVSFHKDAPGIKVILF